MFEEPLVNVRKNIRGRNLIGRITHQEQILHLLDCPIVMPTFPIVSEFRILYICLLFLQILPAIINMKLIKKQIKIIAMFPILNFLLR